jgi:ribosome-binding ATPase
MLQAGIVGLPNVGKSTLFNAVTRTRKAESANYPFCTIEPNVGVVQVPDERLEVLSKIANTHVIIPAAIEFKDIAGLVKGASEGEGLGNQFMANIRECDAIIQVVRCFDDDDIIHTMGAVDPIRDIEIINAELILADISSVEKKLHKSTKMARGGDKEAQAEVELIEKLMPHLNDGKPALTLSMNEDEKAILSKFFLLSSKPTLFAANVAEDDLLDPDANPYVQKVKTYAAEHHGAECVSISARLESELIDLSEEEAKEFLSDFGVTDSGVSNLIRSAYNLLGLITYFTAGEKEARAWTITHNTKAPQAAAAIHTDFEKGFIKAEVVSYEDLVAAGSTQAAREAGRYRLEGKDYIFKDGDVTIFRVST